MHRDAVQTDRYFHIILKPTMVSALSKRSLSNYPLIIHPGHGVFEPASLFIRELAVWNSQRAGSLLDVAYIICSWCNFLQERNVLWNEADQTYYHGWLRTGDIGRSRQGRRANVIMRWYHFLGSRDIGGALVRSFSASISASPLDVTELNPKPRFKMERGPRVKGGRRYIPDSDEVDRVLDILAAGEDPFISERNWLLGKTAYESGLRSMGLAALSIDTVNDMLRADNLIGCADRIEWWANNKAAKSALRRSLDRLGETGREGLIAQITEKRGKTRSVLFPIPLVSAFLEHIWGERQALLNRRRGSPHAVKALWISDRRGKGLALTSIKDILREKGFVAAGVRGSAHSLRAVFLTQCACKLLREAKAKMGPSSYDADALLELLAEIAGHDDPKTLRPYLDEARIRAALVGDNIFVRSR